MFPTRESASVCASSISRHFAEKSRSASFAEISVLRSSPPAPPPSTDLTSSPVMMPFLNDGDTSTPFAPTFSVRAAIRSSAPSPNQASMDDMKLFWKSLAFPKSP